MRIPAAPLPRSELFSDAFLKIDQTPLDAERFARQLLKKLCGFSARLANILAASFTNELREAQRGELCGENTQ